MVVDERVRFEYLGNTPSADVPQLTIIVGSLCFHTLVFFGLPSRLKPLIKSYVVSTVHAVVCVASVVNFLARYSVNFKQINRLGGGGVDGTGDEIMAYSICYSLGYFLYDLLLMLADASVRTTTALVHHVIVIIGFSTGLTHGTCHPCHFYLLAEELSTVPLNLKAIYHDDRRSHDLFAYLFVASFFLSRLIYGSVVCAYAFSHAPAFLRMAVNAGDYGSVTVGLFQAALCLLTRFLNFYWGVLILRKVCSPAKSHNAKSS